MRKTNRGVPSHVLNVALDEVRQGRTVRSVAKDCSILLCDTEQVLQEIKTSENKVQESCPVWAITAIKKSLMHGKCQTQNSSANCKF